jgi:hypothetical protein
MEKATPKGSCVAFRAIEIAEARWIAAQALRSGFGDNLREQLALVVLEAL